jgi:hypothetical protein
MPELSSCDRDSALEGSLNGVRRSLLVPNTPGDAVSLVTL